MGGGRRCGKAGGVKHGATGTLWEATTVDDDRPLSHGSSRPVPSPSRPIPRVPPESARRLLGAVVVALGVVLLGVTAWLMVVATIEEARLSRLGQQGNGNMAPVFGVLLAPPGALLVAAGLGLRSRRPPHRRGWSLLWRSPPSWRWCTSRCLRQGGGADKPRRAARRSGGRPSAPARGEPGYGVTPRPPGPARRSRGRRATGRTAREGGGRRSPGRGRCRSPRSEARGRRRRAAGAGG